MCGIAGIFAYHYAANPVDAGELQRTRDHMAARGPDGAGLWIGEDRRIGLAHRRLSIIDLSAGGAQPMFSADGRLAVTFNGEIYNYPALRADLERAGRTFLTQSDTEVLLHLYDLHGPDMVRRLRGMFAFAIFDQRANQLFLARDPYGIKPLYYADNGWTFRFASQVKALIAGGAISGEPDAAGQVGFYVFGSVPEPFTTHRAVSALEAGHTLIVDRLGMRAQVRYHSIAAAYEAAEAAPRLAAHEAEEKSRAALLDSVRHHLLADVPVGAFLSSGVDSGSLVGLMRDAGQNDIETVTLSFREFEGDHHDEAPLAAEVARHYGTRHTTRRVSEAEFTADLPAILTAMDQPTIDGINTWFVAKAARELGLKVAISGLGGDELFGGYPSFSFVPQAVRRLQWPSRVPFLGRGLRHVAQLTPIARRLPNPKMAGLVELGGTYAGAYLLRRGLFLPGELKAVLPDDIVAEGLRRLAPVAHIEGQLMPQPRQPFARVATLEASLYMRNQLLRDADWAGMAHSLEIRVPLVDSVLLDAMAPITASGPPLQHGKALLAMAPRRPVPQAVRARAKTGFVTPVGRWLEGANLMSRRRFTDVAALSRPDTPWARRWAFSVASASA
ncbi:MAG: asparagine synthase (glutamine-hydrolyzing) [Hyphomicrobiaceae bacterium]|nr:asparagine synthase (glutamine-hydrolyzing) [Hyphomicrobiaceae bacterium]